MNREQWNPIIDPVSCLACGFEPHDMIQYACKQEGKKIEDLTTKEYNDEVFFYVYENHPDFCPERKPDAHKNRYDDKSLLLKAIKALDSICDLIPSVSNGDWEGWLVPIRDDLLAFGFEGMTPTEWWQIADTMDDHWVNTWWNQYIGKEMKE
jgi:hypothetical protein